MDQSTLIERLFEQPSMEFIEHLNIPLNERIIFSGRFGIGKTTFLRDYFFTEKTKTGRFNRRMDYNVVHIFPVNYSIAQNEDIFRYIKYDILLEMLANDVNVEHIDLKFAQTFPAFLRENMLGVAATVLRMIPQIGKDFNEVAGEVRGLLKQFKSYHEQLKSQASNADQLTSYIERIEAESGSIYEQDIISNVIEQELEKLKAQDVDGKPTKENILIIDDLDRIDPEHIFRILNVFAAHFDRPWKRKPGNKFGFDKIVLVCDISNIRQIFKAKFGMHVDFNGYIDKFYSQHTFEFNPYRDLYETVRRQIGSMNVSSEYHGLRSLDQHGNYPFLRMTLEWLVSSKEIDLRNVFKLSQARMRMKDSYVIDHSELPPYLSQLVWQLQILSYLKGDYLSLIDAINRSSGWQKKFSADSLQQYAAGMICIPKHPSLWENSAKADEQVALHGWRMKLKRDPENQVKPFTLHPILNGGEKEEFDSGKLLQLAMIDAIHFLRQEGMI